MKQTLRHLLRVEDLIKALGREKAQLHAGVLQQELTEVSYSALPADLVEKIVIDAEKLNIGDTVTVGDLEIAKNPKIHLHTDRQAVIVAVTAAHTHQEAAEETEEAAPQE